MLFYNRGPKKHHNFDNHPYLGLGLGAFKLKTNCKGLGLIVNNHNRVPHIDLDMKTVITYLGRLLGFKLNAS